MWGALCTLGLFSCTEKNLVEVPDDVDYDGPIVASYEAIKPSEFINVPVKEGFVTVVKQGNKTLLVTNEETTLEVTNPQYSIFTRADKVGVDFSYLPDDGSWNVANMNVGYTMYKTIMFEDLVDYSDYDYNDLIIHVQQYKLGNKLRIYIHPIALGSYDQLSLGADIFLIDGGTKLGTKCASITFSKDVRNDLFRSQRLNYVVPEKTFVNTTTENTKNGDTYVYGNNELFEYPTYFIPPVIGGFESIADGAKWEKGSQWIEVDVDAIKGKTFGINWFIINNDKDPDTKLYAVPAIQDNLKWRDNKGYPYGIISSRTREENWPLSDTDLAGHDWINYAKEKVHLKSVYKNFLLWLEGKANANWDTPSVSNSINAIGYIRGTLGLPSGSKALYDMEGCYRSLGYSSEETNIWNNGNPVHENIPLPDGRDW